MDRDNIRDHYPIEDSNNCVGLEEELTHCHKFFPSGGTVASSYSVLKV